MKFQFKNEYYGDDWVDYNENRFSTANNLRDVALNVAEYEWSQEPMNPDNFEFKIEVKDENGNEYMFIVSAHTSVNFYARKI